MKQCEEEHVQEDDSPLLVVRIACFATYKSRGDDQHRNIIFHSTYIVVGKVCRLVIDLKSYENLVSEQVVQKFVLETEKHPSPYRLPLLKKENEVIFSSKRCLVSFYIGSKY